MPTTAALTALVVSIGGSINKGFPNEQSHLVQHFHSTLISSNRRRFTAIPSMNPSQAAYPNCVLCYAMEYEHFVRHPLEF